LGLDIPKVLSLGRESHKRFLMRECGFTRWDRKTGQGRQKRVNVSCLLPLASSIGIPGPYRRQTAFALPQRDSQRLWQEYIAALKDRLVLLPID